ncbi:MAG: hypothetical protein J0H42_29750 [Rhizobiales bacterium]|nr:hypothetical protein [Hyphomicrobiales bacterium]
MTSYFIMLGAKATGAASRIRPKPVSLYGASRLADGFNSARDSVKTLAEGESDDFISEDATDVRPAAAAFPQTDTRRDRQSGPQSSFPESRDSRNEHALLTSIHELRQRFDSGLEASEKAAGAPISREVERQEFSPFTNAYEQNRADEPELSAPHIDRSPRSGVAGIDQIAPPSKMARNLHVPRGITPAAPADAERRRDTTEPQATRNVAENSMRGASLDRDRVISHPMQSAIDLVGASKAAHSTARTKRASDVAPPIETSAEKPDQARGIPEERALRRPVESTGEVSATRGYPDRDPDLRAITVAVAKRRDDSSLPVVAARSAVRGEGENSDRTLDVPPAVQVSIGRIDIREQRPVQQASARRAKPPRMDLKEYLDRRFREGAP